MVAILGAMSEEIDAFLTVLEDSEQRQWKGWKYYLGKLDGLEVLLARTGVGKVLAAMYTQYVIQSYSPESLIFTGIAGGLHPDLEIGDMVIAESFIQHDMDATALNFQLGEIPYTGIRLMHSDKDLLESTRDFQNPLGKVLYGTVATGDQFISDKKHALNLYETLDASCVEMEGASVGLVCKMNDVPFLLIRIISDQADGKAPENFKAFLQTASRRSLQILRHVLAKLRY
jgi:5'-methylthioadenosine/S-adenosylhomocysteine nucleosidase